MFRPRYDSLRKRLVLPFALLGLCVSALLSGITYWLVSDLESYATRRVLEVEMEGYRNRLARNPTALPPSASLIHGDFLPSASLPPIPRPTSDAMAPQHLAVGDRKYSVLVEDVGGRPYALLYDRTVRTAGLRDLAWILALGTLLMGGLSALLGHVLAGQVIRPIRRLLTEISEKSSAIEIPGDSPVTFLVTNYPDNEIGQLVRALDQFALRLQGFVQRESHFAADVSHELRTPIAVIRSATELLVEHGELPDAIRERLVTIHQQSVRMGEIIEALLLLARESGQTGDPACSMAEIVEEALADCRPWLHGRPVQVVVDIRDRPIVAVEHSLAYVVVSNLLRNAFAHTLEGSITVRLTMDQVEIIDTGVGIAEDRFPAIFDRRVKGEESAGSGLGLSIVARITQLIRWDVGIESQSGAGTRATVRFAARDGNAAG